MQIIKIANVEIKNGEKNGKPWTKYTIIGEDKSSLSTFDKNAATLKAGDSIEAEVEVQGKYTNLKSFKVVGNAPSPVAPSGSQKPPVMQFEPHTAIPVKETHPVVSGPEQGMWWKELGDMIRADMLPYDEKDSLYDAYFSQMGTVLGLQKKPVTKTPPEAIKAPAIVSGKSEEGKGRDNEVDKRMLFSITKTKLKFNTDNAALQWLLQVNKIPQDRIDKEPDVVFREISEKYNWD